MLFPETSIAVSLTVVVTTVTVTLYMLKSTVSFIPVEDTSSACPMTPLDTDNKWTCQHKSVRIITDRRFTTSNTVLPQPSPFCVILTT